MRSAVAPMLPFVSWLGVLQFLPATRGLEDATRLIGAASVLGTLTVLVYRLGVWRQEMENTRQNIRAGLDAHRAESAASFARLAQRLEAIDRLLAASAERRLRSRRWERRTSRRLDELEAARGGGTA